MGTTLSSQLVLSHLTISATLEGIYCDHFHFTNEETGREAAQQVHLTSKWQSSDSRAWALTTRTTTLHSCSLSGSDCVAQDISFPRSSLYPAWTLSLTPCFNYTPRPGSWGYSLLTPKDTYLVRRLPRQQVKSITASNKRLLGKVVVWWVNAVVPWCNQGPKFFHSLLSAILSIYLSSRRPAALMVTSWQLWFLASWSDKKKDRFSSYLLFQWGVLFQQTSPHVSFAENRWHAHY